MSRLNVFTVTSSTYDCVPGGVLSAVAGILLIYQFAKVKACGFNSCFHSERDLIDFFYVFESSGCGQ